MSYKEYKYIVRVYENYIEYRNDKLQHHREGGPAIEYKNGNKIWCINGEVHREDGPAEINRVMDTKQYWFRGKYYPTIRRDEEWVSFVKTLKNPYTSCDGKIVEIDGKKYQMKEVK